jgi:hypothetical protein
MATRDDLDAWIVQALDANGGEAKIVDVATHLGQS